MTTKIIFFAVLLSQTLLPQQLSHGLRAESSGKTMVRSKSASSFPDTMKVLAILVQFQLDNDTRTSGDGRFDLSMSTERIIDSPPHDSAYFADHFTFAQNYYAKASNGKQNIVTTVFGKVITLKKQMKEYAPVNSNLPLAEMITEAWVAVDSLYPGEIQFQQYSMFTIFHAGVGKDIDLRASLGYDPTPLDIPSLYFSLSSFQKLLGNSFQGIPLKNSSFKIPNSVLLPETEVRRIPSVAGDFVLKLSINGLLIASIGSHLGLPDLFDTKTGKTAIGRFGLMDGQSMFSFAGICPPEPSAWEKIYLGWTTPIEVFGYNNLAVPAVGVYPTGNDTIYKIPISAKEYYLVENRSRDAQKNNHSISMKWNGQTIQKSFTQDEEYFTNTNIDSAFGVVIDVDELDWSLPGIINANNNYHGGILIWHIDETIIEKNIATNTINADPKKRGIDLEEADGSQDLGQTYDFGSSGSGSEDGSPIDYWFSGNIFPNYKNEFSENTLPNSLTNSYAKSHITLKNFSVISPRMTFEANVGDDNIQLVKVIKRKNLKFDNNDAPLAADLNGDGKQELIYTSGDSIFVLKDDLSPYLNNATGLFSRVGGKFHPAFYSSTIPGNPFPRGLVAAGDSSIYFLSPYDVDNDGISDLYKKLTAGSSLSTPITARDISALGYFSVGTSDGKYIIADTNIYPIQQFSSPIVSVSSFIVASTDSFNFNGTYRKLNDSVNFAGAVNNNIILLGKSSILIFDSNTKELKRQFSLPAPATSLLSLGDINDDHSGDIVVGVNNHLYVYNSNGSVLDNFPFAISAGDKIIGSAIISGNMLVFGTRNGLLYAIDHSGKLVPGFPLQTGGIVSAPVLTDKYLIVASVDSSIYFWRHKNIFDVSQMVWQTFLGSYSHSSNITVAGQIILKSSELLPKKFAYNWPNPVYSGSTNIRYFLGKSGTVKIKIVNLAGELVDELNGTNYPGMDNEVQWNISTIQSGIYFAQITASGNGEEQSQIVKIAVVK